MNKFKIISADPPWWYPQRQKDTRFGAGIHDEYPPMKTEDIMLMGTQPMESPFLPPVRELAENNSVLFMWVDGFHMMDAGRVMDAWGFRYCCVGMVWVKVTKGSTIGEDYRRGNVTALVRPGHYTGAACEYLLIGARGSCLPEIPGTSTPQVVFVAPSRNHSEKPSVFRDKIDRMYPTGSRIELFCRHSPPGWACWGNEVGLLPNQGGQDGNN